jgi:nucleotide-binding universal stress UspA family protein
VRRILVGVHGSDSSLAVCRWLADLGLQRREVRAAAIFEPPLLEWVPTDDPTSSWHELHDDLEGPWTAPLRAAGHAVSVEIREGIDPVDGLTDLAHAHHVDLIVVGVGSHRSHHRWSPLGVRLASRAQLPVITVPAAVDAV